MKIAAAALILAAPLAVPATAHADDVPTVDQVVAIIGAVVHRSLAAIAGPGDRDLIMMFPAHLLPPIRQE